MTGRYEILDRPVEKALLIFVKKTVYLKMSCSALNRKRDSKKRSEVTNLFKNLLDSSGKGGRLQN